MGSKASRTIFTATSIITSFLLVLVLICISLNKGSLNIIPMLKDYLSILTSGSLGKTSYGENVALEVLIRFPRTFILAILALAAGSAAGTIIGLLFSYRGSKRRMLQMLVNTVPISLPDILMVLLLQMAMIKLHDLNLPHFPVTGYEHPANLVLPVLSLSIIPSFYMAKITYAFSIEAYNEMFVLTARAKGCSESRILRVHIWRRIRPQVTESVYGLIPLLISNLLLVEKLFFYPGLSFNLFNALTKGDMYLFLGLTMGLAAVYSLSVLAVWAFRKLDMAYRRADI